MQTISDEKLRTDVEKNLLVSGGCIASMLLNEPVNDYDIYIQDIDVLKKLAAYYIKPHANIEILDGREKQKLIDAINDDYADKYESSTEVKGIDRNNYRATSIRNLKENQIKLLLTSNGGTRVEDNIDKAYMPVYFSPNAISLSNDIQIVLRFWGNAEEIHKTFDFIHATNYFTFEDGLVRNLPAIESLLTKQLRYRGSLYPVTSIIRAKKFLKRGFNINAGEMLKIMFQISKLDLSNPDVLEEQLIGVDVAYFDLLITALRTKIESDKDFKLTDEYIAAIIDKVFNSTEEES